MGSFFYPFCAEFCWDMLGPLVSWASCDICVSLLASYLIECLLFPKCSAVCFLALLRGVLGGYLISKTWFCLSGHAHLKNCELSRSKTVKMLLCMCYGFLWLLTWPLLLSPFYNQLSCYQLMKHLSDLFLLFLVRRKLHWLFPFFYKITST